MAPTSPSQRRQPAVQGTFQASAWRKERDWSRKDLGVFLSASISAAAWTGTLVDRYDWQRGVRHKGMVYVCAAQSTTPMWTTPTGYARPSYLDYVRSAWPRPALTASPWMALHWLFLAGAGQDI